MSSYFAKYPRCYYTMASEVLSPQPLPYRKYRYYRDIFIFLYLTRALVPLFLYKSSEETIRLYRKYDPQANFIAIHLPDYQNFTGIIVLLFEAFEFTCQRALHKLNAQTVTWQFWYQMVVVNQNQYYESLITDPNRLRYIARKRTKRMARKYPIWMKLAPKWLIKWTVKWSIFIGLENVDKVKFYGKPLKIFPKMTTIIRKRALLFGILWDKFNFLVLMIVG